MNGTQESDGTSRNTATPKTQDPPSDHQHSPPPLDTVQDLAQIDDLFSAEELDAIIEIGNRNKLQKGMFYGHEPYTQGGSTLLVRSSQVAFIFPSENTEWIFARVGSAVSSMNEEFFGFDLYGIESGLQFSRYEAPGGHYDWHIDRGFGTPVRKLSAVLQLSDPKDYKGGELEMTIGSKTHMKRRRGTMAVFPSYILHRVRPVTEGTRYSLVAWAGGPAFR